MSAEVVHNMENEIDAISEMQRSGGRVAANAFTYLLSQIVTWGVSIAVVAVQPHLIGEKGLGELRIANTVVGTVVTFACLSLEQFLIAEVGRNKNATEQMLRASFGLRIALLPIMVDVIALGFRWMNVSQIVWMIGFIHIMRVGIGFVGLPIRSVLAGWENGKMVAAIDFIPVIAPLFAFPLLFLGFSVIVVPMVDLAAVALLYLFLARYMSKHIRMMPTFRWLEWKTLIHGGTPFLVNEMNAQLYDFVTIALLMRFTNEATVGVYSQAIKFQGTFLFVPVAIATAMLPFLARLADKTNEVDKADFRVMQQRTLVVMIATSLPVATMVFMLAHPVCHLLFGHKLLAGVPGVLQISAINLLPLYLLTVFYRFLVAQRKNGIWSVFLTGTVLLNGVLCYTLIPLARDRWQNASMGAALSSMIAEYITMFFALFLLRINPFQRETFGSIVRTVFATAVMGAVIWKLRDVFVLVPAFVGGIVFIVLAWKLKILGAEEQAKLVELFRRKLGRFLTGR